MSVRNKKIQILIANASEAKHYEAEHLGDKLTLIKEYQHPQSRAKRMDLVSDRPGHYISRDSAHGALENTSDPKEVEADQFARELAVDLNHLDNADSQWILITPPHFFGLLNKHIHDNVRKLLFYHLEKDYTKLPQKQLLNYLVELRKEITKLK